MDLDKDGNIIYGPGDMFCPMAKDLCQKAHCAWYMSSNGCAIMYLACSR